MNVIFSHKNGTINIPTEMLTKIMSGVKFQYFRDLTNFLQFKNLWSVWLANICIHISDDIIYILDRLMEVHLLILCIFGIENWKSRKVEICRVLALFPDWPHELNLTLFNLDFCAKLSLFDLLFMPNKSFYLGFVSN